jgi:type IV secretion system protein VirB1
MILDSAAFLSIALQCSPAVAPDTLLAIARQESRLHAYLMHDNTTGEVFEGQTKAQAVAKARALIAAGHSVDMGLMQVNSANLGWLGLRPDDVFEACMNVAAGGRVLVRAYTEAAAKVGPGAEALRIALSLYNTGDTAAGRVNGYVGQVESKAAAYVVPPLLRVAVGDADPVANRAAVVNGTVSEKPGGAVALGDARSPNIFARQSKSKLFQKKE